VCGEGLQNAETSGEEHHKEKRKEFSLSIEKKTKCLESKKFPSLQKIQEVRNSSNSAL